MGVKRRIFTLSLIVLALSYPLYEAVDVVLSEGLGENCDMNAYGPSGRGVGAFCSWGLSLGEVLFGQSKAYLGYALLLGGTVIAFGVVAFWLTSTKPGDRS